VLYKKKIYGIEINCECLPNNIFSTTFLEILIFRQVKRKELELKIMVIFYYIIL